MLLGLAHSLQHGMVLGAPGVDTTQSARLRCPLAACRQGAAFAYHALEGLLRQRLMGVWQVDVRRGMSDFKRIAGGVVRLSETNLYEALYPVLTRPKGVKGALCLALTPPAATRLASQGILGALRWLFSVQVQAWLHFLYAAGQDVKDQAVPTEGSLPKPRSMPWSAELQ